MNRKQMPLVKHSVSKIHCMYSILFFLHQPPNMHADNFPPVISANSLLTIDINIETEYTLSVEDSMDNFTLHIRGGLPENSVLEAFGDGIYRFRWNLQEPTTAPLVFVANDSRGAVSSFVPRVEICACVNGGLCILDGLHTTNSTVLLNCQCTEGNSCCIICKIVIAVDT